jgi:hypothetical protein
VRSTPITKLPERSFSGRKYFVNMLSSGGPQQEIR